MTSGFAEASDGARLYYEEMGAGAPVAFVHGFALDTRMWDDQFEVFAQRYRVVRYDVRGFGRSSLPGREPYMQVADLHSLLLHLQAPSVHLVGLSMGGGIALDFALTYPEAARSLTLVDAALGGFNWTKDWGGVGAAARSSGVGAAKDLWLNDELFAPAREQPKVSARLRQMVMDYSGWHWVNRDPGSWADVPALQRLDQLRPPTLIIVGERDLPDFHRIADLVRTKARNARIVVLPGVGHMSNMEAPEAFNITVLSFLRQE